MSQSLDRPGDSNSTTSRIAVPRAPPLPAPRPFQGVRNAAYKIIGMQSRPPSPQHSRSDVRLHAALGSLNRFASLGQSQDATASHRTGLEINTLSINEKGTHALIGGKEIFKTVKIENGVCVEDRNLRTTIRSTPNQASGETRKVYSIDIADVAWAKSDFGDYVAAATTSGKIILYDLGHAALQGTLLHEHARQVHRVTFNPHRGSLLLSGSQDGTVRLWDVKEARTLAATTLQSKRKFSGVGVGDGVRDVKWSPTDGFDFASSTDSGWIQRWDIRNLKQPKIRIPAHQSTCTSIDWHPDGKHLVSAGVDKTMRIWDFSTARRHKPAWEVRAPYPISNARWRPSCESSMPHDDGARMCTQVATAYDRGHGVVHIWDLRRSDLPFRELHPYSTAPTDLLWHSQDLLWTVGREGVLLQTDIHHTTKVVDRRNLQAVAVAASGEIGFAIQKRHQHRAPRRPSVPRQTNPKPSSMSQSPEYSLLSRSWADDSLDHSFLTTQLRRPSQSKNSSRYSSTTVTPPSGGPAKPIIKLDDILLYRQTFTPRQSAFEGGIPLQLKQDDFNIVAAAYATVLRTTSTGTLLQHVQTVLQSCVAASRAVRQYRLAQTWDIIAFSVGRNLEARFEACRVMKAAGKEIDVFEDLLVQRTVQDLLENRKSPVESPATSPISMRPISTIARALAVNESNSNMTTPLARPVPNGRHIEETSHMQPQLPDPDVDQAIDLLPPSLTSHLREDGSEKEQEQAHNDRLTRENLVAMQFLRTTPMPIENGNHALAWNAQVKPVLNLDTDSTSQATGRPTLTKHNSGESFSFLVGSNSSREQSTPVSHEGSDEKPASMVQAHLTRSMLRLDAESPQLMHNGHEYISESPELDLSPFSRKSTQEFGQTPRSPKNDVNGHQPSPMHPEVLELHESSRVDVEADEAFKLSEMLHELVTYYTDQSPSAQTAAQMLVLLVPLLPASTMPNRDVLETLMSVYMDTMSTIEDASQLPDVLEKALGHIIKTGLNPLQIESILSTYHEQLLASRLFTQAANLRRLSHPAFPSVYEYGLGEDNMMYTCGNCRKRVNMVYGELKCSSCSTYQAPCAVCLCSESPFAKNMGGSLITACLLCNHSIHANCAGEWFGDLGGHGCPTEGCLCVCVA